MLSSCSYHLHNSIIIYRYTYAVIMTERSLTLGKLVSSRSFLQRPQRETRMILRSMSNFEINEFYIRFPGLTKYIVKIVSPLKPCGDDSRIDKNQCKKSLLAQINC